MATYSETITEIKLNKELKRIKRIKIRKINMDPVSYVRNLH